MADTNSRARNRSGGTLCAAQPGSGPVHDQFGMYKTFWQRVGASLIDFLIFSPLIVVNVVVTFTTGHLAIVIASIFFSAASISYAVILHATKGKTVGKIATGITVLDADTHGKITWEQAIRRESPTIVFAIYNAAGLMAFGPREFGEPVTGTEQLYDRVSMLISFWWLIDAISIFTDPRRRSLHDRLAGTVVVKDNYRPAPPDEGTYYPPQYFQNPPSPDFRPGQYAEVDPGQFSPPVLPKPRSNRDMTGW